MNGRLYDPVLGRMLSADNYVQNATNTQCFNRYSYCVNNPLRYTDPSGEIIFTLLALVFCPPLIPLGIAMDAGSIANTLQNAGHIHHLGAIPALPTLPVAPTAVSAGIFDRMRLLVQRIKNHSNYNEAMGHDLNIIGSDEALDRVAMKPTLEIVISGGEPIIKWKKGHADAIRLEVDRSDNQGWQFLAINTISGFHDKQAFPATPTTWKYRAIYIIADEPVGQMSDEAKITVS